MECLHRIGRVVLNILPGNLIVMDTLRIKQLSGILKTHVSRGYIKSSLLPTKYEHCRANSN